MARTINAAGLQLIKSFEGCVLQAYWDSTGKVWTIGYGSTATMHPEIKQGLKITLAQAEEYLKEDLHTFEAIVDSTTYCPVCKQLNENQFSALVSFTYNCGSASLKQLCKSRAVTEIPAHIEAYCNSGGVKLPGLVRRRAAEKKLYETAVEGDDDMTTAEVQAIVDKSIEMHCLARQHLTEATVKQLVQMQINTNDAKAADEDPSDWSKEDREWAESVGIITGTGDGLHYKSNLTREQCIAFMHRMYKLLTGGVTG